MIRKKTKITYINSGAGHWGMHDGYGSWPEDKYFRVLGILFCKKHFTIPNKQYESYAGSYVFTCNRCHKEHLYTCRRNSILKQRKLGRVERIIKQEFDRAQGVAMINALKSIYGR